MLKVKAKYSTEFFLYCETFLILFTFLNYFITSKYLCNQFSFNVFCFFFEIGTKNFIQALKLYTHLNKLF